MIRVLPRDAFNDANLLKCVGQLTMLIEDGMIGLKYEYDGKPFDIVQDKSDGSTSVRNIKFFTRDGRRLYHSRPMNSRDAWPLTLTLVPDDGDDGDDCVYYAFNEKGKFLPTQL